MKKWRYFKLSLFHCVLPLITGALVYLFLRPSNFLSRLFNIQKSVPVKSSLLWQFFFVLPDFCWSYSLSCALFLFSIFYNFNFKTNAILIFILLVCSEVVQVFFPRQFRFDVFDLLAAVLAFILSSLQMKIIAYEKVF